MKWSFASVGILIFGLLGLLAIVFLTDLTLSNDQDYYSLKEAAQAAMLESVDVSYYRLTGELKICKEKFVENFTRRFKSSSTFGDKNYKIEFYGISESPPKVSIKIIDPTGRYNLFNISSDDIGETQISIANDLSGILDFYPD